MENLLLDYMLDPEMVHEIARRVTDHCLKTVDIAFKKGADFIFLVTSVGATLACSYLSFILLLGLGANATLGCWWADPVAARLMAPRLVKGRQEGIRGDGCSD